MSWNRILWGIEFSSKSKEPPTIIGEAWEYTTIGKEKYKYQPTRALLFYTRKQAREWCKYKNNVFQTGTYPKDWHVKPVKVRETIVRVKDEN